MILNNKSKAMLGVAELILVVRDLQKEISFYQKLGFKIKNDDFTNGSITAEVGTERNSLLKLVENKNAVPPPSRMAGLYHFAVLLPDRKSLGEAYLRIRSRGIPFDGFADHGVSEALYLTDLEGNGIEIYTDKPEERWPRDSFGQIKMSTKPLDIDSIVSERSSYEGDRSVFPEDTKIGHIHLKATDLQKSVEFYTNKLGLELTQRIYSAAFLSYSGYHHHLGINTWETLGGLARSLEFSGLEGFTLVADYSVMKRINIGDITGNRPVLYEDPDAIRVILKSQT